MFAYSRASLALQTTVYYTQRSQSEKGIITPAQYINNSAQYIIIPEYINTPMSNIIYNNSSTIYNNSFLL